MFQISRLLTRRLRAVFRRCSPRSTAYSLTPMLHFIAGKDGLRIRLYGHDVVAEYHAASDSHSPEELVLFLTALADFESTKSEPVRLSLQSP